MNTQKHLLNLLKNSGKIELSPTDKKILSKSGIEEFIFKKLTTKKFRKYKLQDGLEEKIKNTIKIKVKNNKPIRIIFPQGGYKLWRLPTTPKADWAEFLQISYLLNYVSSIAAAYKPGIEITYFILTLLMEKHDNLTTEEIQKYVDSFQKLINEFSKNLPNNIRITIQRDADLYPRKEYFKELERVTPAATKKYDAFPESKKLAYKKMSMLNIKWDGAEDWTTLPDPEKEEKIRMSGIYEKAGTSELKKVSEIFTSANNICVFTKAGPLFIGIGSTKSSIAKHWVGFGVLVKKGDSYSAVILTPSQYKDALKMPHAIENISILDDSNFKEIMVFDKPFLFHRK